MDLRQDRQLVQVSTNLTDLPVEILREILRYLIPENFWINLPCHSDPNSTQDALTQNPRLTFLLVNRSISSVAGSVSATEWVKIGSGTTYST